MAILQMKAEADLAETLPHSIMVMGLEISSFTFHNLLEKETTSKDKLSVTLEVAQGTKVQDLLQAHTFTGT
jgi:hypothetical protein